MVGQPEESAWSLEDLHFDMPADMKVCADDNAAAVVAEEAHTQPEEQRPPRRDVSRSHSQVSSPSCPSVPAPVSDMGSVSTTRSLVKVVDPRRERLKGGIVLLLVIVLTVAIMLVLAMESADFPEPDCSREARPRSCEPCGRGTVVLPFFGEYEKSWPKWPRAILYLVSLLWAFAGMGIVCDRFMEGIEEITSAETVRWIELRSGSRRKYHGLVWNATVANLTLMALGSSAPEIMLSAIELVGNEYYAGVLGPSTIVGTAAFNLLVITGICICAIPAPEVRKIELFDVFGTTTVMSIWAYIWLIVILLISSPNQVDLWESIATLIMFPVLIVAAFVADKRYLRQGCGEESDRHSVLERMEQEVDGGLPTETLRLLGRMRTGSMRPKLSSRPAAHSHAIRLLFGRSFGLARYVGDRVCDLGTQLRTTSGRSLTDHFRRRRKGREIVFGFKEEKYVVLECVEYLFIVVAASQTTGKVVEMKYSTVDGSAKAGKRFQHVQGTLIFGPNQLEKTIRIPIVDNDVWDPDEEFYVELKDLQIMTGGSFSRRTTVRGGQTTSSTDLPRGLHNEHLVLKTARTTVRVLNDDMPSTLSFEADEVQTSEGSTAKIKVLRRGGTAGQIKCTYHTVDGSAIGGKDYEASHGELVFEDGERIKEICINILVSQDHAFEEEEVFTVMMSKATPGVLFNSNSDRGPDCALCDIVIEAGSQSSGLVRWLRRHFNRDRMSLGMQLWGHQFQSVLYCNGTPEDQAEAGCKDWFFHIFTMHWKIMFVAVPPSLFMGGWACFWMALVMIGVVTAYVGDIASLIGCCVSIPNDITAITLVALGTSLPDTLASKTAAQQEDTADNSIGNILGSNCVNVFLGLGISWTIGAVYWKVKGATPEWRGQLLNGHRYEDLFMQPDGSGSFVVPAGTLLFSVCCYTFSALVCIALLLFRRMRYGGELGGPACAQQRDASFLFLLWCIYVLCVSIFAAMNSSD